VVEVIREDATDVVVVPFTADKLMHMVLLEPTAAELLLYIVK
jgi:hypothetical protein